MRRLSLHSVEIWASKNASHRRRYSVTFHYCRVIRNLFVCLVSTPESIPSSDCTYTGDGSGYQLVAY